MSDSEAGHEDVVVNENTGRGDENEQSHFDITKWAQNCKINRKTVSVLRKEEVTSIETLTLLTQSDLACLGLLLGQRKLLEAAINQLSYPTNLF